MNTSRLTSLFTSTFLSLALGMAASSACGEQIAYEGFTYGSSPNLAGANGGSGWGGQWFKLSSIPTGVTTEGLSWPGLPTSVGSAFTAGFASVDYTRYSRAIAPFTAPDDVVYVSFLFRPNVGFGVGGGLAFGTWENGMVVGLVPGSGKYGLSGFTGPSSLTSKSVAQNETVLLVASARKTAGNTITWSLHVNPSVGGSEPQTAAATMSIPGTALPQAVVLYNDGGYSTDEIRVATTWASALGQLSEPCVGDLDGDGAVGGADLGILLSDWGGDTAADLNNDDVVDGADLGMLLGAWGECA